MRGPPYNDSKANGLNEDISMNVGRIDLVVRLLLGMFLVAIGFLLLGGFTTSVGSVAIVLGTVLGVTGIFSFCPVYKLLGISTLSSKQ